VSSACEGGKKRSIDEVSQAEDDNELETPLVFSSQVLNTQAPTSRVATSNPLPKGKGKSKQPEKPKRVSRQKAQDARTSSIISQITQKTADQNPLSVLAKAIELFKKDHKPEDMLPVHRIGFNFYLGKEHNATIFNNSDIDDRNIIIKMYIDALNN
jgi:hypothetical protein